MNFDLQRLVIGANPTLLARIADEDGNLLKRSQIYAISVKVQHKATGRTPAGFDDLAVPLEAVLDDLEVGTIWSRDNIGYNFRYTLPGTVDHPALPWKGEYFLHVVFVRVSGVPFVIQYDIEVQ